MKVLQKFIADLTDAGFILNKSDRTIIFANDIALDKIPELASSKKAFEELIPLKTLAISKRKIAYLNTSWCEVYETEIDDENAEVLIVELKNRKDIPDSESIETMKDMIQVMLHRLRSPLTGVSGYIELMEAENDNPKLEKRFESVNTGFNHIYDIMDELEVLYNLPTHYMPEEIVPVNIHKIINEVLVQFSKADRERIKYQSPAPSIVLPGIAHNLKQALKILITNALEYSDDPAIEVKASTATGGIVTVKNTGTSIPEKIKNRLFYPFITTKADNLGIGLTTALFHVQRLGGTIFHEEDEHNTYFHIQFPLTLSN